MKFKSLFDLLKQYDTEEKCREYFVKQRWSNGIRVCPHCNNIETNKPIYKTKRGIYRCGNCRKDFSVRTNTFMGDSPIPYQKWLMALFLITSHKKGISSLQLAKDIGITQKSAWFIIQRIANIIDNNDRLRGTVEVDETYIGGKESNKHKNKKTKSYNKVQGDKTAILGMIQRSGKVVLKKFEKINKACIAPHIEQHITQKAIVNTDESPIYKGALNGRERRIVNHSAKQYVFEDNTTNRIECIFAHLKRMINGVHIFLSAKHIQKYANMFCFRMNTRCLDEYERISALLSDTANTRLQYKQAIA